MATLVVVTHYRRQEMLLRLLRQLGHELDRRRDMVVVVDDGTPGGVYVPRWVELWRYPHYGKEGYWKLWTAWLERLRGRKFDRVLKLDDDVQLQLGALRGLERAWLDARKMNPAVATLNPLVDNRGRGPCWTGQQPEQVADHLWDTGWVDCMWYSDREVLEVLDYRVPPVVPEWIETQGSTGVGASVSRYLAGKGRTMYQLHDGVVTHGSHASMMNPHRETPL